VGIAKTVADNYEDEELRDTFINISLDLCVLILMLSPPEAQTDHHHAVFSSSR
jgi:hypothetical protein